jgi:hypothetical protein
MPSSCRLVAAAFALASLLVACASFAAPAVHSPMTADVVARMKAVLARGGHADRRAFVKVGDSNTAAPSFLKCFAGADVKLADHAALEATRAYFGERVDALHSSFSRASLAARAGWLTQQVLAGATPHLDEEIAVVKPAFAVVMLGTNDNRPGGAEIFVEKIAAVIDRTLAAGVVPILTTLPPRDDAPSARARVAEQNRFIRELAASRKVPLVDLHAALEALPRHGLSKDGVHLAPAGTADGSPHPCWFRAADLDKGMNVRNLLTLEALDRARRFLLEGETPEVVDAPARDAVKS